MVEYVTKQELDSIKTAIYSDMNYHMNFLLGKIGQINGLLGATRTQIDNLTNNYVANRSAVDNRLLKIENTIKSLENTIKSLSDRVLKLEYQVGILTMKASASGVPIRG